MKICVETELTQLYSYYCEWRLWLVYHRDKKPSEEGDAAGTVILTSPITEGATVSTRGK